MVSKQAVVVNKTGLHARPATDFVQKAKEFQSKVTIRNLNENGEPVNAKSIVFVLAQGMGQGTKVEITAEGPDEKQAVDDLVALMATGFGE